jgi:hypothetical protein
MPLTLSLSPQAGRGNAVEAPCEPSQDKAREMSLRSLSPLAGRGPGEGQLHRFARNDSEE